MIAQINLYHLQFRKKHLRLSFSRMLIIAAIMIAMIPLQSAINFNEIEKINSNATQLQQEFIGMNVKWKNLQRNFAARDVNKKLLAEQTRLETILTHRDELVMLFTESGFDLQQGYSGYSDYMIALARQHRPNLRLTGLDIINNGSNISIEGNTYHADAIPDYIKRLSLEPVLSGTQLEIFKISNDTDSTHATDTLQFTLATKRNTDE